MRLPPKDCHFNHGVPRSIPCVMGPVSDPMSSNKDGFCVADDDNLTMVDFSGADGDYLSTNNVVVGNNDYDDDNIFVSVVPGHGGANGSIDDKSLYTFDDETIYTDFHSNDGSKVLILEFEGIPEDMGATSNNSNKKKKKRQLSKKEMEDLVQEEIELFLQTSSAYHDETMEPQHHDQQEEEGSPLRKKPTTPTTMNTEESTTTNTTATPPPPDAPAEEEQSLSSVKDLINVWTPKPKPSPVISKKKDAAKVKNLIATYNKLNSPALVNGRGSIILGGGGASITGGASIQLSISTRGASTIKSQRSSIAPISSTKNRFCVVIPSVFTKKNAKNSQKKKGSPIHQSVNRRMRSCNPAIDQQQKQQQDEVTRNPGTTPRASTPQSPKSGSSPNHAEAKKPKGILKKTYRGLGTILEQSNVTPSNNFWKQREETQKKQKALAKRHGWKFWRNFTSSKRSKQQQQQQQQHPRGAGGQDKGAPKGSKQTTATPRRPKPSASSSSSSPQRSSTGNTATKTTTTTTTAAPATSSASTTKKVAVGTAASARKAKKIAARAAWEANNKASLWESNNASFSSTSAATSTTGCSEDLPHHHVHTVTSGRQQQQQKLNHQQQGRRSSQKKLAVALSYAGVGGEAHNDEEDDDEIFIPRWGSKTMACF